MIIRRLIAPLAAALVTLHAGQAGAQDASPAPPPNQSTPVAPGPFQSAGTSPLVGGGFRTQPGSGPMEVCVKEFAPLRDEAEKRGKLIKAASERKAPPDEACKLIGSFDQAEIKMIRYVEANAVKCSIPQQIADQLKANHRNTDALLQKVCMIAKRARRGSVEPVQINDIGDPAMEPYLFRISPPSQKSGPMRLE